MFQRLLNAGKPTDGKSLAGTFSWLGWTGFWLQVVFGSLPIIMMVYYFTFSRQSSPRQGLAFVEYLTILNLFFLAFTIFWSYRYTRLARQLRDSERTPSRESIISTVWTGVTFSAMGTLFSMTVIFIDFANLLFYFLKAPQAGVPVTQKTLEGASYWVSSVDVLSLMSLILILFAELIVLVFSLWLLFRSSQVETPKVNES
jgi:Protein of unknown function (DUF3611)